MEWEYTSFSGDIPDSDDEDRNIPDIETSTEGRVIAEYGGLEEVDGVTVAIIELAGEIVTESSMNLERESERGTSSGFSETTTVRQIEGRCLWNVERGFLHSLEVEVELNATTSSQSTTRFGDREFNHESESERSGRVTFEVLFEAVE